MKFLKYTFWPIFKTRVKYYWWTVRYGGRKNIPPALVFNEISRNMDQLNENLMKALRAFPGKVSEKEQQQFFELFKAVGNLGEEINKAKTQQHTNTK